MARVVPLHLKKRAQFFGPRVLSEQQHQKVGEGKSHQQAQEALRLIHLQVKTAQSQVALPIAKTLLDLHALAIQPDHLFGGQPGFGVGRDDQEPRLLKSFLAIDDHVHRLGLASVVEDMAIAERLAGAMGQAAQADPLPAASDLGLNDHVAPTSNQKRLMSSIQLLDQGDAGVAAIKNQNQPHAGRGGLRQPSEQAERSEERRVGKEWRWWWAEKQ